MDVTPVLELTRIEIVCRIEAGAQRRLKMTADEFVRAYKGGQIKEPGQVADLLALAHLLPDDDPLFVAA